MALRSAGTTGIITAAAMPFGRSSGSTGGNLTGSRTGEVVGVKQAYRQRLEDHLLAPGALLPRSVWSNKVKIADDLGVAVSELEYVQAIRHDASRVCN